MYWVTFGSLATRTCRLPTSSNDTSRRTTRRPVSTGNPSRQLSSIRSVWMAMAGTSYASTTQPPIAGRIIRVMIMRSTIGTHRGVSTGMRRELPVPVSVSPTFFLQTGLTAEVRTEINPLHCRVLDQDTPKSPRRRGRCAAGTSVLHVARLAGNRADASG